jgi:hypothetical protein
MAPTEWQCWGQFVLEPARITDETAIDSIGITLLFDESGGLTTHYTAYAQAHGGDPSN